MADEQAEGWRLALVLGDDAAARVLAAYYSVKPADRDDLLKLGMLAGVNTGVAQAIARLDAAGLLVSKAAEPPQLARLLLAKYVSTRMSGKKAR